MARTALIASAVSGLVVVASCGYAAFESGGVEPEVLNSALLAIAVAALVVSLHPQRDIDLLPSGRLMSWAALLVPVYVGLQLIPVPHVLLRLLDPTRATIADSLSTIGIGTSFAALSIAPDKTWMHLSRITGYVLLFVTIRHAARNFDRRLWTLSLPLIAVGAVQAVIGLSQSAAGDQVLGTYLNENHFCGLLEMVLPLAATAALSSLAQCRRQGITLARAATFAVAAVAALMIAAAVPLSLSRAGFLSMLGSLAVVAAVGLFPAASRLERVGIVAVAAAVAVVALFALPTDRLIASFGELANGDGRWPVFVDSLRMFVDFPLFGTGFGTFHPGFLPYQTTALTTTWTNTHNDFLQFLTELGVVGVVAPAVFVFVVWREAARTASQERDSSRRLLALGCVGGLTAMLIHSLADFNMYIPANAMVFMYIAGIAAGVAPGRPSPLRPNEVARRSPLDMTTAVLSAWLVCYAVASLAFLQRYQADPSVEASFCRVGVCNADIARAAVKARYGGAAERIPPDELAQLVARDPAGGYNWIDMGESLEEHGRLEQARGSFSRGLELGPNIPLFQLRAANFHLRQQELTTGLPLMARSVQGNPDLEAAAFSIYQQRGVPLRDLVEHGLGSSRTAQAFLRTQLKEGSVSASEMTWRWMADHGWIDDDFAAEYVVRLMSRREVQRAASAWAEYTSATDSEPGNLVFNGGFERPPTASPFDWRISKQAGVRVSFDGRVSTGGSRSARLDFDGTQNVKTIGLSHGVYLPEGRYRLQAMLKTEGLTTREGIGCGLSGAGIDVSTDTTVGTADWTSVEREFDVPAGAGLLQLSVTRPRSFRFDNQIAGTAWIDDVRITKVGPGA